MPVEIKLPPITPDFDSGTISSWTKQVGDSVAKGEVIVEIETDKAVVEVEAEASGVLGKILAGDGAADVPVHATIGLLLKEGESEEDLDRFLAKATTEPAANSESAQVGEKVEAVATVAEAPAVAAAQERVFASPLARRIAGQSSISLAALSGRGPNGRILKADVEAAIEARQQPQPQAVSRASSEPPVGALAGGAPHQAIAHSGMRKVIAARLQESKRTVPHFYLEVACTVDRLLALRAELNAEAPTAEGGYKLTVNDFVIKAAALAMRDVPEVNASWTDEAMLRYEDVDISIAVSTNDGLITPILRKADTKGLATLSNDIKELASRAREGRLKPQEYKGGGFSISNLGMYGISAFSAIINPPQACILAVGAAEKRPVVVNNELAIATVVNCTLSVDHRVVDGAVGARFLQAFKHYMEYPTHLMLRGG